MSKDERIKTHYGTADAYKFYKETKNSLDISQKEYTSIIKEFHNSMTNLIVYRNFTYVMPYLGSLSIKKRKANPRIDEHGKISKEKMPVNYKATKELWATNEEAKRNKKLVYHLNEATDNYIFRWTWDKSNANVRNKSIYTLLMSRANKRKVAQALKDTDNGIDFFENIYKKTI